MTLVSSLASAYAALLALCGGAFLFMPVEIGMVEAGGSTVGAQVLGAAMLGFAAAIWTARQSVLGGIYGRAVVVGTQTFTVVGLLALLGSFPDDPSLGVWLLGGVLAGGAVVFGWLLLGGPQRNGETGEAYD